MRQKEEICKVKELQCNICNQHFRNKNDLKVHTEAIHENVKDIFCSVSEKYFARRGDFNRHVRVVHENIGSFNAPFVTKTLDEKHTFKYTRHWSMTRSKKFPAKSAKRNLH